MFFYFRGSSEVWRHQVRGGSGRFVVSVSELSTSIGGDQGRTALLAAVVWLFRCFFRRVCLRIQLPCGKVKEMVDSTRPVHVRGLRLKSGGPCLVGRSTECRPPRGVTGCIKNRHPNHQALLFPFRVLACRHKREVRGLLTLRERFFPRGGNRHGQEKSSRPRAAARSFPLPIEACLIP